VSADGCHDAERLPGGRVPVLDGQLEGLRDVVGVHVVHQLGSDARDGELLPRRESPPHAGVQVA
jgi:hypothetical protein